MQRARYSIGVDLGTTNCVLSSVDSLAEHPASEVLPIPQFSAPGAITELPTLPSFYYLPPGPESAADALRIFSETSPKTPFTVGLYARAQGETLPGRVVQSAKSWLCHAAVEREAPILPWASPDVPAAERLSPVQVSAAYLSHLKDTWNEAYRSGKVAGRFEDQIITVTVPASFDEDAERLTLDAAKLAGYPENVRLLEEPQAAFYHWLELHRGTEALLEKLPDLASRPQQVLVCDVGGGTTDFSLFTVYPIENGPVHIERTAVSEHTLLGGDNIDLAIAHEAERLIAAGGSRLSRRQWNHLVFQSRVLKEKLLSGDAETPNEFRISLPSEGASLFASSLSVVITREMLERIVLDGFFPLCAEDSRPARRQAGLRELGLPYASDTAISRHLAAFVAGRKIDAVLYAGGTLKPQFLRDRLCRLIAEWQSSMPAELSASDMDLAIGRGAAYYGWILRTPELRIRAGHARSVYLELQSGSEAAVPDLLCVMPRGTMAGETISLEKHVFQLLVNRPVRFQAYSSLHRPHDQAGDIVPYSEEEFHPLPPLQTVITVSRSAARNDTVAVRLESSLTELGMLQLYLVGASSEQRFRLDFNVRRGLLDNSGETPEEPAPAQNTPAVAAALDRISLHFGKRKGEDQSANPKFLVKELEQILKANRDSWPAQTLRAFWPALQPGLTRRGRSVAHEVAWLYLAGFSLRPGYGDALDPWRVSQLWRAFELGMSFPKEKSVQTNWWILWRRVSSGLSAEQQRLLFQSAAPGTGKLPIDSPEAMRLIGSLERLDPDLKGASARALARQIKNARQKPAGHLTWALGRILARAPLYSGGEATVDPSVVGEVFDELEALDWNAKGIPALTSVFAQAARPIENRAYDLEEALRDRILHKLRASGAALELIQMASEYQELTAADQTMLFGEALPSGLRLWHGRV